MIELVLVIVFALAFVINLFNVSGATAVFVITGALLSMIYFYISVVLFNGIPFRQALKKDAYTGISKLRIIGSAASGVTLSVLVIGVLFVSMYWQGGKQMLLMGITLCIVVLCIALYKYFTKRGDFYPVLIRRLTVWIAAGVLLFTLPQNVLIGIKYRNHPEFRDALLNSLDNPEDEEARQKFVDEAKKMDSKE